MYAYTHTHTHTHSPWSLDYIPESFNCIIIGHILKVDIVNFQEHISWFYLSISCHSTTARGNSAHIKYTLSYVCCHSTTARGNSAHIKIYPQIRGKARWARTVQRKVSGTYPFITDPTYMPPPLPSSLVWPTMLIPRKLTVSEREQRKWLPRRGDRRKGRREGRGEGGEGKERRRGGRKGRGGGGGGEGEERRRGERARKEETRTIWISISGSRDRRHQSY